MIFSRWRSDTGGYDYYDSPSTRYGIGDDLPVPKLPQPSRIGVASTDIGRAIPVDAKLTGSGPLARGMVAPMNRSGLLGLGDTTATTAQIVKNSLFLAIGVGIGVYFGKKKKS